MENYEWKTMIKMLSVSENLSWVLITDNTTSKKAGKRTRTTHFASQSNCPIYNNNDNLLQPFRFYIRFYESLNESRSLINYQWSYASWIVVLMIKDHSRNCLQTNLDIKRVVSIFHCLYKLHNSILFYFPYCFRTQ